jgi:glycogen synthase
VRIGIFTTEYAGVTPYTGGVGVHYAALAAELAHRGHEVQVIVLGAESGRVIRDSVPVHAVRSKFPGSLWWTRPFFDAVAAARALKRLGPFDVVLGPEWQGIGALAAVLPGQAPIVTNLVTSLAQIDQIEGRPSTLGWRERLERGLQTFLEQRQTRSSAGVIACSTAILRWTQRLWGLPSGPAKVLPNFIDVERTQALGEGPLPPAFPTGQQVVLFFGRLEIRKGPDVLGRAMQRVWSERPEVRLVLVGGDAAYRGTTMSSYVTSLAEESGGKVHYLGPQPSKDLLPCVRAADVVAFPSRWENFSIAALEARALGRAIVATRGSGFEDFFTDGRDGLLVAPGDDRTLADALARLLADAELRCRLGNRASDDAALYAATRGVDRYVEFFSQVVGRNGTPQ